MAVWSCDADEVCISGGGERGCALPSCCSSWAVCLVSVCTGTAALGLSSMPVCFGEIWVWPSLHDTWCALESLVWGRASCAETRQHPVQARVWVDTLSSWQFAWSWALQDIGGEETRMVTAVLGLHCVLLSEHGGGELCCNALSTAAACWTSALLHRATLEGELPLAGQNKVHTVNSRNIGTL